jgi:hypothetical protein
MDMSIVTPYVEKVEFSYIPCHQLLVKSLQLDYDHLYGVGLHAGNSPAKKTLHAVVLFTIGLHLTSTIV